MGSTVSASAQRARRIVSSTVLMGAPLAACSGSGLPRRRRTPPEPEFGPVVGGRGTGRSSLLRRRCRRTGRWWPRPGPAGSGGRRPRAVEAEGTRGHRPPRGRVPDRVRARRRSRCGAPPALRERLIRASSAPPLDSTGPTSRPERTGSAQRPVFGPAPPELGARPVQGDGGGPGRQRVDRFAAVDPLPGPEERLLGGIFGQPRVSRDQVDDRTSRRWRSLASAAKCSASTAVARGTGPTRRARRPVAPRCRVIVLEVHHTTLTNERPRRFDGGAPSRAGSSRPARCDGGAQRLPKGTGVGCSCTSRLGGSDRSRRNPSSTTQ